MELQFSSVRNQEPSSRGAFENSGLISADSGLQLDLEIALNSVLAMIESLLLIQPCRTHTSWNCRIT